MQPNEELSVTIELKLPTTPGKYILHFRLVHGDNQEFGDEVTVDLVANAPEPEQVCCTRVCCRTGKCFDCQVLNTLEEPLIETSGDTFYVDQDKDVDVSGESVEDLDNASVNSWIVVRDDDEAAAEPPGPSELSENSGTPSVVEETPGDVQPCTVPSEKEAQRNSYNKQVYMSRYD